MARLNKSFIFLYCILVFASYARAKTANYDCAISQVLSQKFPLNIGDPPMPKPRAFLSSESNHLGKSLIQSSEQNEADSSASLYLGRKFKINKVKGEISGSDGISTTGYMRHTVLKAGNSQNSFVLLIEGFKGVNGIQSFIFLEVAQYSLDMLKPFKAIGLAVGDEILLGTCSEN